ncbi:hypothetical protein VOI54_07975 [Tamlana sp. 2201CG12-4]|uniref:hypothetical protein n=1 Tax=Tamlana sp. 2201CG12-4 TaxID=3112582 RepID=UPI002DBA98C9|nr:hypothetical protein [Tamlana sp. 2201CG12-4]MEC3906954.1 hypothetical protein [Tamlana sp. 2201CG12-4]
MLFLRKIQSLIGVLLLLISLVSFSGFVGTTSKPQRPQTELVHQNNQKLTVEDSPYKALSKTLKIPVNQYTVFTFKWFLTVHTFDFSVTLKSQKEAVLQFLDYQHEEQHLIAKTTHSNYLGFNIE